MPVRATMQTLITYVRDLINDPVPTGPTVPAVSDQQLQDYFDLNRQDVHQQEMRVPDIIDTAGNIIWTEFWSAKPFWEDDFQLQGPNWNAVTATTAEPLIGRWTFAASQDLPIYISGKCYDMYAVASRALTLVEGQLRCTVNFSADGLSVQRLQQLENIRTLRSEYKKQGWIRTVKMVRGDMR